MARRLPLRELDACSVDAVVTDPPYGLEFMGKEWDAPWKGSAASHADARTRRAAEIDDPSKGKFIRAGVNAYEAGRPFQSWCEAWAAECLRVLKPGGHLLAFGGTRTWHRLACAIEDAGFEIRDSLAWMYGSGFPKSLDVSKAIDRAAGAERAKVRHASAATAYSSNAGNHPWMDEAAELGYRAVDGDTPATPDAARWQGWGTALKPAYEPIVLARKPLAGTVAGNVLAHGTGALNVDGCRVGMSAEDREKFERGAVAWKAMSERAGQTRADGSTRKATEVYGDYGNKINARAHDLGRWPANVVLDEAAAAMLDEQSGQSSSPATVTRGPDRHPSSFGLRTEAERAACHGDSGGASRFFYTAKADAVERPRVDGVAHPTVKPLDLMRWLVRLVTPPGGIVLDPFPGSGTTVEACLLEGFQCVAVEREADYLPLIVARITRRRDPVAWQALAGDGEPTLFDGLLA